MDKRLNYSWSYNVLSLSETNYRLTAQANFRSEDWQGCTAHLLHLNKRHKYSKGKSILPTSC